MTVGGGDNVGGAGDVITFHSGDLRQRPSGRTGCRRQRRPGSVLCHGFDGPRARSPASRTRAAERHRSGAGWVVCSPANFRGCGRAEGDFFRGGLLDDIHAAVEHVVGAWRDRRRTAARARRLAGAGEGARNAWCEARRRWPPRPTSRTGAPYPCRPLLHARQVWRHQATRSSHCASTAGPLRLRRAAARRRRDLASSAAGDPAATKTT